MFKLTSIHAPFLHLNLTRNPFRELTKKERAQAIVTDVPLSALVKRLREGSFAAQFFQNMKEIAVVKV